jgi:predicted nucleotidyltransferase
LFNILNDLTAASLRILSTLAWDPDRLFHQREVAKEAGVSLGSANSLLTRLVEGGLVSYERRGSLHTYRYNLGSSVARQLKVLLNVSDLEPLTNMLVPISGRVILYGSCAKGTDGADSDVDLFVLTENKTTAERLIAEHGSRHRISPIILDSSEYNRLRSSDKSLYDEIERGVVLWETR